jgi:hypothetical protein
MSLRFSYLLFALDQQRLTVNRRLVIDEQRFSLVSRFGRSSHLIPPLDERQNR